MFQPVEATHWHCVDRTLAVAALLWQRLLTHCRLRTVAVNSVRTCISLRYNGLHCTREGSWRWIAGCPFIITHKLQKYGPLATNNRSVYLYVPVIFCTAQQLCMDYPTIMYSLPAIMYCLPTIMYSLPANMYRLYIEAIHNCWEAIHNCSYT